MNTSTDPPGRKSGEMKEDAGVNSQLATKAFAAEVALKLMPGDTWLNSDLTSGEMRYETPNITEWQEAMQPTGPLGMALEYFAPVVERAQQEAVVAAGDDRQRRAEAYLAPFGYLDWLAKISPAAEMHRRGVTTAFGLQALHDARWLYYNGHQLSGWSMFEGLMKTWLIDSPGPAAVCNRLRWVYTTISRVLRENQRTGDDAPFRMACVAAGSALGMIHALADFLKESPEAKVEVVLEDIDPHVLKAAGNAAFARGVYGLIEFVEMPARRFAENVEEPFDFVECCGLLDYSEGAKLEGYIEMLLDLVAPGGTLIISMITPVLIDLVQKLHFWPALKPMESDRFTALVERLAGPGATIRSFVEPCGMHTCLEVIS